MAQSFANVIIDISHEKVDKTFQYIIPDELKDVVISGVRVLIPFGNGNTIRKGYVVEVTEKAEFDTGRMKKIAGVADEGITVEAQLIKLAWWIKEHYGSTMNQALKTVLPVSKKIKAKEKKHIRCLLDKAELSAAVYEAKKKNYKARERLLTYFEKETVMAYETAVSTLKLSAAALKPLIEKGMISVETDTIYRNPVADIKSTDKGIILNEQQEYIASEIIKDYDSGVRNTYLIHGITGSGKTEVYMELISHVLTAGKQVIVLIPEIALTYQTVMRFYGRFGKNISIINSRLSQGERFDQFERAKNGEVSIMIGPRSALFTPFPDTGLIIIDEEHENAYKSETIPRYHAREVAQKLADMYSASLILGSATPSLEAYKKAEEGQYRLFNLDVRAKSDSSPAKVEIVDLREEMKSGNKSILSIKLQNMIADRLKKKEQIMLFMNRRGYSNFISCRSCGEAIKCPHCDVSLTLHRGDNLICHYCGYRVKLPKLCPACNSPYIAGFGTGTQKIESIVAQMYPSARILRMDADTTSKKGGHEAILSVFSSGNADILIGTQMIVKGHDFPNVTLMGILAADLSLYTPDFRCAERTFQLLTQAAGRAGRAGKEGDVIIQTYSPEHYSITAAAAQDYNTFYRQEMAYRRIMKYPPICTLLTIQVSSESEERLTSAMNSIAGQAEKELSGNNAQIIGPAEASVYKVNDIYRKILYIKHENYDILVNIKNKIDEYTGNAEQFKAVLVQYDFS